MFGMSAYSPVSLAGAYASHLLFHAKQTQQKERGGVGDKGSGVWQRARGCSQEEMVCSSAISLLSSSSSSGSRSDPAVCCYTHRQQPVLKWNTELWGTRPGPLSSRHAPARRLKPVTGWRWLRCGRCAKLRRDSWEVFRPYAAVSDPLARLHFYTR